MSIQKRTQGTRSSWVVRWLEAGKHHSRSFPRKSEAEAFEAEIKKRQRLGAFAPPEPSRQGLGEWLPVWFERGSRRWAASTLANRHSILGRWIDPYLLEVRMCDLGPARVREWLETIRNDGAPAQSANHALRLLSSALGAAVRDGLLPFNPAIGIEKFPVEKARPRVLTPMELERLRRQMPSRRDIVLLGLMAYAGLRPEEAFALRWSDVGNVLVVDRAFTHGELRPTKTHRRRTVPIIAPLREDIERLRAGVADPYALVCPSEAGTFIDLRNWRPRVWAKACEAAGVSARPYDCRHAYASLMIHSGQSIIAVAAALGHASATTTMDVYAHLVDDARLAPQTPIEDAVLAARQELEPRKLRSDCSIGEIRLRLVGGRPELSAAFAGENAEPTSGFEPLTPSLRVKCSTN